ncbi:hypothetical protein ACP275_10G060300 [Erythranthe tilingii]
MRISRAIVELKKLKTRFQTFPFLFLSKRQQLWQFPKPQQPHPHMHWSLLCGFPDKPPLPSTIHSPPASGSSTFFSDCPPELTKYSLKSCSGETSSGANGLLIK